VSQKKSISSSRLTVPPPRLPNEEVIIEEELDRDRLITPQIKRTVYGMTEEGLRHSDSGEYFQGLLTRMQDEMCPTTATQIAQKRRQ